VAVASALALFGCPNEELAPVGPCTVSAVNERIPVTNLDQVDVLFVIDNSKSMEQEQANLAVQLPRLVEILASGEIKNAMGEVIRKFPPVKSLHLGVVSSDMGANGAEDLPGGNRTECGTVGAAMNTFGDDGLLINTPTPEVVAMDPSCNKTFERSYLEFVAEGSTQADATALGADFGCIARLGIKGCGFEQQLEAMWKALAPSTDTSFSRGTAGHGNAENAGFIRQDSVIAIIHVSDEEDCSIPDGSRTLFSPNDQMTLLNVSCGKNPNSLHPVGRYVAGLKTLRPDNPDLLIFAAIVGVPPDAEGMVTDGVQDFDGILALPDMQFKEAEPDANGNILPVPACNTSDGVAYPARRFVEVAKAFGTNGIIRSICRDDFSSALTSIIDKIANQLQGACLPNPLILNEAGLATCDIVEYLRAGTGGEGCDEAKGRKFLEMRETGGVMRAVCSVTQVAVNKNKEGCQQTGEENALDCLEGQVGWYYDDFTADVIDTCGDTPQRISFTPGEEPANGSEVRFECLQPVFPAVGDPQGKDAVALACDRMKAPASLAELAEDKYASSDCGSKSTDEYTLRCDRVSATCKIMCQQDANCPDSWVCDRIDGPLGFCVNPTCPAE
jgi:hypothetical protein